MLMLSVAPAPAVGTAAVALVVVVVGAVDVRVEDQLPGQIVGHGGVCIAGKAAEQLDAGLHQRCLRPGADAAAEQDVCAMLYEKARQCAVALTIRRDDLGAQELAVFGLIELELCGAAKVLEHLTVFEWDCDFMRTSPLLLICTASRMLFASFLASRGLTMRWVLPRTRPT